MSELALALLGLTPGTIALVWQIWRYLQERSRRPELSVHLDPILARGGPPIIKVGKADCAFFRLAIHNKTGREAARDVAVSIEDFRDKHGAPLEALSAIDGMWLAWSDTELTNPRAERQTRQIPPGSERRIDFIHLNGKIADRAIIDVRPQPAEGDYRNRFFGLRFSVRIVVTGENIEPAKFAIDVAYDGTPWDGQRSSAADRIQISEPRASGSREAQTNQLSHSGA